MILGPRFVFIHHPKTGGTFIRKVLEDVAGASLRPRSKLKRAVSRALIAGRGMPRPLSTASARLQSTLGVHHVLHVDWNRRPFIGTVYGQHNTCRQIPRGYRELPIVSVIRNPFDRYVALYRYQHWTREPGLDASSLRARFPNYPNLSFRDFLDFAHGPYRSLRVGGAPLADSIGLQTVELIDFFARDWDQSLREAQSDSLRVQDFRASLFPVRFLHQETLNASFHALLVELGYKPTDAAPVLRTGRIRPVHSVRTDDDDWRSYYDPELTALVMKRERLVFELFPEYIPEPARSYGEGPELTERPPAH